MSKSKLTISDVKNACPEHCEYVYTEKLFFKNYSLRLGFDNIQLWTLFHFNRGGVIMEESDRKIEMYKLRDVHSKIVKFLKNNNVDFKTRRENKFHVYLSDFDIAVKLIKRFRMYLIDIHGPVSDVQIEKMKNNCKVVVRNNLFYKKYRYKIVWPGSTEIIDGGAKQIYDLLQHMEPGSYRMSENLKQAAGVSQPNYYRYNSVRAGWRHLYDWHKVTLYLEDETDYLQIKLMTAYNTVEELEVMTMEEIDSDK